jgi:hypothetical protein
LGNHLAIVSLNPRQCHRGGGFARKRRITPHFIFHQAIRLRVIPQTGRKQSRLDSRPCNGGANDPRDQNQSGANPQKMRSIKQTATPFERPIISANRLLDPAVRVCVHLRTSACLRHVLLTRAKCDELHREDALQPPISYSIGMHTRAR